MTTFGPKKTVVRAKAKGTIELLPEKFVDSIEVVIPNKPDSQGFIKFVINS